MRRLLAIAISLLFVLSTHADNLQESKQRKRFKGGPAYIYRITLTDKQGSPYDIGHPTRFLSRRSVERRKRQGLGIDSTDLPVNPKYIKLIEKKNIHVIGKSRWQNTLLVKVKDTTLINSIGTIPCVKACKLVWQSPDSVKTDDRAKYRDRFEEHDSVTGELYGTAADQIKSIKGHRLHDIGLRGEGMMIAVIDGGFKNVDRIPVFQQIDIRGWYDFVNPDDPHLFTDTDHGTRVLSAMAIHQPYYYVGTAPKASYWLPKTTLSIS